MSIPVPTVPAVKAALLAALEARTELTDDEQPVVLSYGQDFELAPDAIWIGESNGVFTPARMVGGGGALWLDETYDLEVNVWVMFGDDEEQAAEVRANELAAVVLDTVRLDPSLGDTVLEAMPAGYRVSTFFDEEGLGRLVQILITLRITTCL